MKYYHATLNNNIRHTILNDGIRPGMDGRVYLCDTPEKAAAFMIMHAVSLEQFTVIEVETDAAFPVTDETFGIDISEFACTEVIAPHKLRNLCIYCNVENMDFAKRYIYGYAPIIYSTEGEVLKYASGKEGAPGIYIADVAPDGRVYPISRLASDIDELNRTLKGALKDLEQRWRPVSTAAYR